GSNTFNNKSRHSRLKMPNLRQKFPKWHSNWARPPKPVAELRLNSQLYLATLQSRGRRSRPPTTPPTLPQPKQTQLHHQPSKRPKPQSQSHNQHQPPPNRRHSANVTVVSLSVARHSESQSQRLDSRKSAMRSMRPYNRPTKLQTRQKYPASLSTRRRTTFSPLSEIPLLP